MKYTVVIEQRLDDLITKVNEQLDNRWELAGGVVQTHDGYFAQAIVAKHIRSKVGLPEPGLNKK